MEFNSNVPECLKQEVSIAVMKLLDDGFILRSLAVNSTRSFLYEKERQELCNLVRPLIIKGKYIDHLKQSCTKAFDLYVKLMAELGFRIVNHKWQDHGFSGGIRSELNYSKAIIIINELTPIAKALLDVCVSISHERCFKWRCLSIQER